MKQHETKAIEWVGSPERINSPTLRRLDLSILELLKQTAELSYALGGSDTASTAKKLYQIGLRREAISQANGTTPFGV